MNSGLERIICFRENGKKKCYLLSEEQRQIISFVLNYAKSKHGCTKRKNGIPYIEHPIAVAQTLVKHHADYITICAGLLHDVVEEQMDMHIKQYPQIKEKELLEKENEFFMTLEEDIKGYFSDHVVKPLLFKNREKYVSDFVKDGTTKIIESKRAYHQKIEQEMGAWFIEELHKQKESDLTKRANGLYEKKKKEQTLRVTREVKKFLNEKYGLRAEDHENLEKIVTHIHDLSRIVDIVRLLTREKGTSYCNSIIAIFQEKERDTKEPAILTKMADRCDNVQDMQEEKRGKNVFTSPEKLYCCFKNVFVLNTIKKYLLVNDIERTKPMYQLFTETCRMTTLTLEKIADSARSQIELDKVTPKDELEARFDGRISYYNYHMHGHKEKLAKALATAEDQYSDALAFLSIIKKLACEDHYISEGLNLDALYKETMIAFKKS